MTTTLAAPDETVRAPLPGARMLRRTIWLLVVALLSGFVYSTLLLASRGGGSGNVDADGHYLDAAGNPTSTVPTETDAVMHANPAIPVLIAAIVLAALVLVLRVARDESSAVRILSVAMIAVAAVAVCALVAGYLWFLSTPLEYWTAPGFHFDGFPFAAVTVTSHPVTGS